MLPKSNLELAFDAIQAKQTPYTNLWSYYDGEPKLKYSNQRIKQVFNNATVYFAENWSAVIINAILDRLVLKGFEVKGDDALTLKINDIFASYNINLDAQDVHEAVAVTGEAFIIVDTNSDNEVDIYYNDPSMCVMFYDADRPKKKAFAAKKWQDTETGIHYINLYYPDRTEKYVSDKGNTAKSFTLNDTLTNENGIIPVFHFRSSRRKIKSELDKSTISMLDSINKLFSNMMAASEIETFKLTYIISTAEKADIKIGPDRVVWLVGNEEENGQDTSIGQLGGSDLSNYTKPISELATHLSITSNTPRHYFTNVGANISGEALIVQEAALVKKVVKRQEALSPVWQEFIGYLVQLIGVTLGDSNTISPAWDSPEADQPLTEAQTVKTLGEAKMPLEGALKYVGKDDAEIKKYLGNSQPSVPVTGDNINNTAQV